jgi:hypothetical protein
VLHRAQKQIIGGLAAAAVAWVCLVSPAARAQGGTAVWYAGGDGAEAADQAVRLVLAAAGENAPAVDEVGSLADALFAGAPLWPVAVAVQRCRGAAPVKLETALARAERALVEIEFEAAVEALAPLDGQLACVDGAVSPTSLGRASLLLGYLRHLSGEVDGARGAFAQAAVFDPDVVWEANFSPQAQPIFNAAVLEALRTRDAHVRGADGSWSMEGVALDGAPLPQLGAVRPGIHQLAFERRDGSWLRLEIELAEARTLRLLSVDDLVERVNDADVVETLVTALAEQLEERDAGEAWVVDLDSERTYRFRASEGTLAVVEAPRKVRKPPVPPGQRAPRSVPVAGPVMVIGGAAVGAVGLGLGIDRRELALQIYEQVAAHNDQYERHRQEYEEATREMTASFVVAAIGGAVLAIGVPTWIVQAGGSRRSVALSATVGPGPGACPGGTVWLVGRW